MNNKFKILIIAITVFSGSYIYPQSAVIRLKNNAAIIDNNEIMLKHIAEVQSEDSLFINELNELKIANAPKEGITKFVTRYDIIRILRKNKIDIREIKFKGPDSAEVLKPSVSFSSAEIYEKAKEFIFKIFNFTEENTTLELQTRLNAVVLPDFQTEFSFRVLGDIKNNGSLLVNLDMIQNNQIKHSQKIYFTIRQFQEIWVAKRTLNKGEIINEDDICSAKTDITKFPPSTILSISEIKGLIAKRTIKKGSYFEEKMLTKELLVKRGQTVTVIVDKAPMLQITITGKAMEQGYRGDVIKIKNMDSQKIISGIVKDSATVIVR